MVCGVLLPPDPTDAREFVGRVCRLTSPEILAISPVSERKDQTIGSEGTVVSGTAGFAIWRSLYFSKLLSARNRFQVR
eukprot:1196429-Prorocentrum_minimum.AAC.5